MKNKNYILSLGVNNHAHASSNMTRTDFWNNVKKVKDACNTNNVVPYIKITNKQIKEHYNKVYCVPYCNVEGVNENFDFWYKRVKERLNLKLLPIRYYNRGVYGWNYTAYPTTTDELFICSYYRNIPANAINVADKLQ